VPLTPEDVKTKKFTAVRLREGYDMAEVDQFLDEVEAELRRLAGEREAPSAAGPDAPTATGGPKAVSGTTAGATAPASSTSTSTTGGAGQAGSSAPSTAASGQRTPGGVGESSIAAARLLELATRNADELMAEAKSDAERIVEQAKAEAERLATESKETADRVESDARARAGMLESETAERRAAMLGDLEEQKRQLGMEIDNLRAFEREYRSRLRSYFQQQLQELDGAGGAQPA
jgi:DivIVA domain-containing protein